MIGETASKRDNTRVSRSSPGGSVGQPGLVVTFKVVVIVGTPFPQESPVCYTEHCNGSLRYTARSVGELETYTLTGRHTYRNILTTSLHYRVHLTGSTLQFNRLEKNSTLFNDSQHFVYRN